MKKLLVILLSATLLLTCGCSMNGPEVEVDVEKVVHVYIEPDTLPEGMMEKFTAQTGIRVKLYDLTNEQAMLGKLKTGYSPFDIIIGNNVMLEHVGAEGNLLQKLDTKKLSNIGGIRMDASKAVPENLQGYLLPYTRTYAVLLHDVYATQTPVTSYSSMWSPMLKGKINIPKDAHLMSAVALKARGYSINSTDKAQLKGAEESLCALNENAYSHNSDTAAMDVAEGKGNLSVVWAKDAQAAYEMNQGLEVLYPREGCIMQATCIAMPATAPNPEYAYQLIDYLLQAENCAAISAHTGTESLHTDISAYTDVEYEKSIAMHIAQKADAGNEYLHYVTDKKTYENIWNAFVHTRSATEEVQ